jgi:hypothetical protein
MVDTWLAELKGIHEDHGHCFRIMFAVDNQQLFPLIEC